ncbi:hypothetical protein BDV33DRAFT_201932 [Aspergillus novoparasiticus]|uniref:Uncharacterized protein n=1 Tax=Aspergillus novoparasiticus TaxID=986946 RepID=A0A5N6EWG1_9EURO|nr:hypothetical protein BDV33DRAFT_201932 [Aspergillus novoparasiticus]
MKFTVVSLVTVAFLSVGPTAAGPIDSIQDPTTTDGVSRTDDAMPAGPSTTVTSDKSHHAYTPAHHQNYTEDDTADAISRTNDAMPLGVGETLTSDKLGYDCTCHQGGADAGVATTDANSQTGDAIPAGADDTLPSHELDHDCTDAHAHRGVEDAGAATTDPTSQTDIAIPAMVKAPMTSQNLNENGTDAHAHEDVKVTDPATATTAPGSEEEIKARVKRAPPQRGTSDSMQAQHPTAADMPSSGGQGDSPSPKADNFQGPRYIHGTCSRGPKKGPYGRCKVTMPGEAKPRTPFCMERAPCLYLGSCVVDVLFPVMADCS